MRWVLSLYSTIILLGTNTNLHQSDLHLSDHLQLADYLHRLSFNNETTCVRFVQNRHLCASVCSVMWTEWWWTLWSGNFTNYTIQRNMISLFRVICFVSFGILIIFQDRIIILYSSGPIVYATIFRYILFIC